MVDPKDIHLVYASFVIRGKDLLPENVTEDFGITPTRSFARGDKRNETKVWPHGYWELSSEDNVKSLDLVDHIKWLVYQLEPIQTKIARFLEEEGVRADISCFWMLENGHGVLVLDHHLMDRITALDLVFEFDIYCSD